MPKDGDVYILYNDGPAPAPLYDTRNDFFTDNPDQTAIGGAPTTAPGFGPNTRTVMQIRIKATAPAQPPWNGLAALQAALPAAFAAGQDTNIVPNSAYNAAYGANEPDVYVNQLDQTLNLTGVAQSVAEVRATLPGQNYTNPPTVTFFGGGGSGADGHGDAQRRHRDYHRDLRQQLFRYCDRYHCQRGRWHGWRGDGCGTSGRWSD